MAIPTDASVYARETSHHGVENITPSRFDEWFDAAASWFDNQLDAVGGYLMRPRGFIGMLLIGTGLLTWLGHWVAVRAANVDGKLINTVHGTCRSLNKAPFGGSCSDIALAAQADYSWSMFFVALLFAIGVAIAAFAWRYQDGAIIGRYAFDRRLFVGAALASEVAAALWLFSAMMALLQIGAS